ncbi:sensor domain-containing diguanylate cyclase [Sulfoacidibacillus ferrooxidans]|uniref:GGDEF domain-containing protein n=1 Tax=Sulfoacidibacillus ferrooxidans TaxID=2005001 RepID=A0A9X1VA78_9BACL|nr:sensor domain-containing diguanylate cyclase [Sulfoacidibacillus ferrooxidans]MCI0184233.1 hypothetical protein [Sulfoacidibacillus ferrooxidans]
MSKLHDESLFGQISRIFFEALSVQEAANTALTLLKESLCLHRIIYISTYTGVPTVLAYAGGQDMTLEFIEQIFSNSHDSLRPLLKLKHPVFIQNYPNHEAALYEFVQSGSESVALIPFEGGTQIESGLLTFHRSEHCESWDADMERLLDGVSQLIFMGIQRLYYFEEHERLLYTDEMTGCLNRRAFMRDMEAHMKSKDLFCLTMIDLDDFKLINDSYGHLAGDQVLRQLTSCLIKKLPSSYQIYRLGGDEFAIFHPYTEVESEIVMNQINNYLDHGCEGNLTRPINLSAGCSNSSEANFDMDHLITMADRRMYEMKRSYKTRRGRIL